MAASRQLRAWAYVCRRYVRADSTIAAVGDIHRSKARVPDTGTQRRRGAEIRSRQRFFRGEAPKESLLFSESDLGGLAAWRSILWNTRAGAKRRSISALWLCRSVTNPSGTRAGAKRRSISALWLCRSVTNPSGTRAGAKRRSISALRLCVSAFHSLEHVGREALIGLCSVALWLCDQSPNTRSPKTQKPRSLRGSHCPGAGQLALLAFLALLDHLFGR